MALPDDVWVEWAPTVRVNDPSTQSDWATLAYPLKVVSYRRGIHRAAQAVEASEATIVFDNKSRALDPTNRQSPLWPSLAPRRPIRIRARHSGRVRTLWAGLIAGIYPTWEGRTATATIRAVDRRGIYADSPAPSSAFRSAVDASRPRWWFPLDERGGDTAYNRGFDPIPGQHVAVNLNGGPLTPYGSEGSAQYGGTGTSRTVANSSVSRAVAPLTIMALAMVPEGPAKEMVIFGQGPGPMAFFGGINIAADIALFVYGPNTTGSAVDAGRLNLTVTTTGGSVSSMITPRIDNGAPRLIFARYGDDGAGFKQNIRVDDVQTSMASPSAKVPRPGTIAIGNDSASAYPFKGALSHIAMWDRYLSDQELSDLWSAHYQPRIIEKPQARIAWILDQAQDLSPRALQEAGREYLGPYAGGLSVGEAADRAAATDGGIFFMDAEGRPAFYSRYHQGRVGGTYSTDPATTPGATLQALDIDMDERGFYTSGKGQVATPNPITADVRHPNAGYYGDLPWSPTTEYLDLYRAGEGARRAIGEAVPVPHLTNADHYAQAADMEEALDLDVWDSCTVVGHPPSDAGSGPFIGWGQTGFWDTLLTDGFTRANGAVGSSEGLTPQAWVASTGSWSILSNQLQKTATDSVHEHLTLDLGPGQVDQYASVTVRAGGGYQGLAMRFTDNANYILLQTAIGNGSIDVYSATAGAFTYHGSAFIPALAAGDQIAGRVVGQSVVVFLNGATVATVPIVYAGTGTRAGVVHFNVSARSDNVTIQAAPPKTWGGPPPVTQPSRVLEVDMAMDFVQKTTRKRMALEPSMTPAAQVLPANADSFDAGSGGWLARLGLTTAAGSPLPTTTTTPISGTASGSMVAFGGSDAQASLDLSAAGRTGRGLWAEVWFRPRTTPRQVSLRLDMLNAAGAVIETYTGPPTWEVAGYATRAVVYTEAQAPSVATIRLVAVVTAPAASEEHLIDEARTWASTEPVR